MDGHEAKPISETWDLNTHATVVPDWVVLAYIENMRETRHKHRSFEAKDWTMCTIAEMSK